MSHAEAQPSRGRASSDFSGVLASSLGVLFVVGLWELAPRLGLVREQSVPPLSRVLTGMVEVWNDPRFVPELIATSQRWALGLLIAIGVGVTLGVLMGRLRPVFMTIDPILTVLYPIPKAALILPLVLLFGAGDLARVTIIVLGSLLPIVTATYHGTQGINPRLEWSARAMGTGRVGILSKIIVPAALPSILSGIRLALAISLFVSLASELLIRQSGSGAYLFRHLDNGNFEQVWATGFLLAILGFLVDFVYVRGVRWALPWLEGEV